MEGRPKVSERDYRTALVALLSQLAAAAEAQRRKLYARRAVHDGTTMSRVRCDRGCGRRVAAVHATELGPLVVPYGRTRLYRLPATEAVAPELPGRLAEHPEVAPELAAAVFGYLREHVTGGALPTEQRYRQFCARLGAWLHEQPVSCRCECSGGSLHWLAVPAVLSAAGTRREVGVSTVLVDSTS